MTKTKHLQWASMIAAGMISCAGSLSAAVIHVDGAAVGGNDGTSWASAYASLQSALEAAVDGDEIWVAAGTYRPSSYNGLNPGDPADLRLMHFRLKDGVGIYGGFDGTETSRDQRDWENNVTTLSGDIGVLGIADDNCYHVFYQYLTALGEDSVLDGFTLAHGQADHGTLGWHKSGGAIYFWGASAGTSPTIRNCRFSNNYASSSGGAINFYGGNHDGWNFTPELQCCSFEANTALESGGAIYAGYKSSPTIQRCMFSGNTTDGSGGAIYFARSDIQIRNCLLEGNSATWGGALNGNITETDGVTPTMANCTIVENTAAMSGGGLYLVDAPGFTLANGIAWGNVAPSGPQIYEVNADPTFVYSCIQDGGFAGVGNIAADPQFANAPGEDWRLTLASPCVDAGNNPLVPEDSTEDLDGVPRFIDGDLAGVDQVDMGAYEFFQTRSLTMVVNPPGSGATDPSVGVHADMMAGVRFPIVATPATGNGFASWRVTVGDASISGADLAEATVLLLTDAEVTVDFMEMLAAGRVFGIAADELLLPAFTIKPKVYGQYDHPVVVGKLGLKAAAKVLTKVDKAGTDPLDGEWTKKIKLYDAKAFKAAQKVGERADAWVPANQENLPVVLHVASKEIADGDQPLRDALLAAPEILTATVAAADGVTTVTFEGNCFGTKGLKASREYVVDDGAGGTIIKQQKLKVLKPTEADALLGFVDSKGKPAFMNAATGASKAVAVLPAKLPKGDLNDVLVLDNGVGLAAWTLPE
jgi:predicted outer membrane repeat protein